MRDLLNILDKTETLNEGVGLSNRKPGEKFKNPAGDVITFQGLEFYPESGKFPPDDTMSKTISALKKKGVDITWTNKAAANSGGFAVATFTDEQNNPTYLGRFFQEINPNKTKNNFPHDAIPGGFKYQSKAGQKENSGLKPSEWLTQFQNNTPESILQQVIAKFGQGSDEANALQIFINSNIPCQIPKGNMNPEAFRDYFAEVLQPIALVLGKKVRGNAIEAANIFFGPGADYSDCTISFNSNTIGGLYDSLLVNPDGKQIKLSSKGKDGASASVTNLQKAVEELKIAPAGKKLLKKYAEEIEILNTIQKQGHFGAPLELAIKYGLINDKEAQQVMNLKNFGPKDDVLGSGVLSKRLQKMYAGRTSKSPERIIPIEHMIAAIAYPVADYINKNTNFGEAASSILNNAALVQMYTYTNNSNNMITITALEAKYPSEAVTGVLLDASKVYFSTGGKGNYTFTILKNGATPQDVNTMDPVDDLETDQEEMGALSTDELDQLTDQPRLTGPGAKASKTKKAANFDTSVTGREKRKKS